jgi:hypothetical protein
MTAVVPNHCRCLFRRSLNEQPANNAGWHHADHGATASVPYPVTGQPSTAIQLNCGADSHAPLPLPRHSKAQAELSTSLPLPPLLLLPLLLLLLLLQRTMRCP